MAWIKSAKVVNLAGRAGVVEFNFNRDVNVLWGVNGCGKTSLLKLLHGALQGDARPLARVPFKSAEVVFETNEKTFTRTLNKGSAGAQAAIEGIDADSFEFTETLLEESKDFSWTTKPRLSRPNSSFQHQYLPISRVTADGRSYRGRYYYPDSSGMIDEAVLDKVFASDLQNLWRETSVRASSRISDVQRSGIASILQTVIEEGPPEVGEPTHFVDTKMAYRAVKSFFDNQLIPFEAGSAEHFAETYRLNPVLRQVVSRVLEIQEQTRQIEAPIRRIEDIVQDAFSGGKRLRLDGSRLQIYAGRSRIPVESLSSGERQMLRMLHECLAAEDTTILIDEPELSMHVDWQYKLIRSMRDVNPDCQIVVATHSPEIMAELPDRQIFELVQR